MTCLIKHPGSLQSFAFLCFFNGGDPAWEGVEDGDDDLVELDSTEDLKGSDKECFQLIEQLQAREAADKVGWEDLEFPEAAPALSRVEGSEVESQRLGSGQLPVLDQKDWEVIEQDEPKVPQGKKAKVTPHDDALSELTLSAVLKAARVGDADLCNIDSIKHLLLRCLLSLRVPSDEHVLEKPWRFREQEVKRKLNWHQQCEHDAHMIRLVTGLPAKRTSRAAAWRNLSASLKKHVGVSEECGDIVSGMVCLYSPVGFKETSWGGMSV